MAGTVGVPVVQADVDPLDPATGSEGFEAFYLREYHAVVRLAYALSGSRLAAEDIAQEAFLVAFRDWERIRQPSAWVRKVVVRRAGRTAHRWLLEAGALARLLAGRGPAVAELPEEDAEVWRAVRALPRRQAQVVALRYVADAPVAEIAQTLGMAEGTVKAQLHRARQTLATGSRAPGRTTMLEERLQRAVGALERSVVEVDAAERLQALGRRRRRQRTVTAALALAVVAAMLAGAVVAVGIARRSDPRPQPVVGPDPTAPARVAETFRLFGDPVAMAVRGGDVWVAGNNPSWVTRWVTPTNPMTRQTPTIALPAAPTRLAAATDAVWVLTPADNRVVRIDPATNQVVATIGVGRAPSGLAVGAGGVWVSRRSDGAVVRIDPATNRVVATIPVGRAQGALTVADGVVWVALPEHGLGRIDPAGNRSTVVRVPGCCAGELAAGEGALWVANRRDGSLVRVDPASGRVVARVLLPKTTEQRPHQVAVGDGAVWVTSAATRRGTANLLWRVDPASNQVTGTLDLGPTSAGGIPNSVAAGNGAVWVGGITKGSIVRLEPG